MFLLIELPHAYKKICFEGQKQNHENKPIENKIMLFRQSCNSEKIKEFSS